MRQQKSAGGCAQVGVWGNARQRGVQGMAHCRQEAPGRPCVCAAAVPLKTDDLATDSSIT